MQGYQRCPQPSVQTVYMRTSTKKRYQSRPSRLIQVSSMNHSQQIRWLVQLASQAELVHKVRMIAALTFKGRTIAVRPNSVRTDPFHSRYARDPLRLSIHAETACLKAALKVLNLNDLERCTLYVARAKMVNGKFVPGLAKPCLGCQRAIASFSLAKVVYSLEGEGWEVL